VNENHRRLCRSDDWSTYLQGEVLAALTSSVKLGDEMLEIGPGPGAATEWLAERVGRLVAVELDPEAAHLLRGRFEGSNVEVVLGDGGSLGFEDASFDAVGCFTMLHHVPTLDAQRSILTEAVRVLRPGGVFLGSDSLASQGLHDFHEGDTYNPIDPATLLMLLRALGCQDVTVKVDDVLTFIAHTRSTNTEDEAEPRPDPRGKDAR
jgi:ubiquinone/menaquinone biosynthesis C-methylase UbiE